MGAARFEIRDTGCIGERLIMESEAAHKDGHPPTPPKADSADAVDHRPST